MTLDDWLDHKFNEWCERERPSGDVHQVQRAWSDGPEQEAAEEYETRLLTLLSPLA